MIDIEYRKGASNKVVDAPSRQLDTIEYATLFVLQWQHWDKLKEEPVKDTFTTTKDDIFDGRQQHTGFTVANGLLY